MGISSGESPGLSICLGEGYQNFFSTELKMCNYDNPIGHNACKLFFFIQAILMSNLIDIYCTYFISKTINSQTEASKNIIGEKAYIIRKKYVPTHIFCLFYTDLRIVGLERLLLYWGSLEFTFYVKDWVSSKGERLVLWSLYHIAASRSTSWLVTSHVTSWVEIQLVTCPKWIFTK